MAGIADFVHDLDPVLAKLVEGRVTLECGDDRRPDLFECVGGVALSLPGNVERDHVNNLPSLTGQNLVYARRGVDLYREPVPDGFAGSGNEFIHRGMIGALNGPK